MKRLMGSHATREDEVDRPAARRRCSSTSSPSCGRACACRVRSRTRSRRSRSFYLPEREGRGRRRRFALVAYERWMETGDQESSTGSLPTTATTASRRGSARLARGTPGRGGHPPFPDGVVPAGGRATANRRELRAPRPRHVARERAREASRRPRRSRPPSSRAAGFSPPPRLAPARGQAGLVGPLPPDGRHRTTSIADARRSAGLEFDGTWRPVKKSIVYRFRFDPPQEHQARDGARRPSIRRRARRPAMSSSTRCGVDRPKRDKGAPNPVPHPNEAVRHRCRCAMALGRADRVFRVSA